MFVVGYRDERRHIAFRSPGFCPQVGGAFSLGMHSQFLAANSPTQNAQDTISQLFNANAKFKIPCSPCCHPPSTSQAKELLREAESRLSFLKIATPRGRVGSAGATRAVYRDGKVMDGEKARQRDKARHSNWGSGNLDPDSVRQHKQNLARGGFANHQQVLGPHGF